MDTNDVVRPAPAHYDASSTDGDLRVQSAQQYPTWKRNMGLLYDTFWNHNLK